MSLFQSVSDSEVVEHFQKLFAEVMADEGIDPYDDATAEDAADWAHDICWLVYDRVVDGHIEPEEAALRFEALATWDKQAAREIHGELIDYLSSHEFVPAPAKSATSDRPAATTSARLLGYLEGWDDDSIDDLTNYLNRRNWAIEGKVFAISSPLLYFTNRSELADCIRKQGGEVSPVVTPDTSYVVTGAPVKITHKTSQARELGVPIITEEDIIRMLSGN